LDQILSDGTVSGIYVYDFNSRQLQKAVEFGNWPRWLADCHRLLFAERGKVYLVDDRSQSVHEVLSAPPHDIQGPAISRDDRMIVFHMTVTEADVWLATFQ
jgi:tricorn protease-like protein